MSWVVPVALEDAVYAAARGVVGDAALATAALTKAIVNRSKRYTSDRERLAAPADPNADLAARAAFFTIADTIEIAIPLAELARAGALPGGRPVRVVDLGAGCGAMTLGLIAHAIRHEAQKEHEGFVPSPPFVADLEVLAIDRDVHALRIAGAAVRAFAEPHALRVDFTARAADATTTAIPDADMIVAGTLLNELPAADRLALVERALAALGPAGVLIVIEPALRDTTRALHELRDAILGRGLAHVFAPCTRRAPTCPMLANPDDWCHEDRPVTLPPRTAELARLTHLRDDGLKFSYLTLCRSDAHLAAPTAWRVVSEPFAAKGKLELFGCSEAGRVQLRLLKRHRSTANRAFERAHRGDVLVIEPALEDRDLASDTHVERIEA